MKRAGFYLTAIVALYLAQEAIGLHLRLVDDESWYLLVSQNLVQEGRLRIPVHDDATREFWPGAALLPILEASMWYFHDISIIQARLLTVCFGVGTILATFALARRLFDIQIGLFAALLCAMDNMTFLAGRTVRPEILVCFFTITAMWLLLKSLQDNTWWPLILSGITVGTGMIAHPNSAAAALYGVLLLYYFGPAPLLKQPRLYTFAACCLAGFLPYVAFFVYQDSKGGFAGFRWLLDAYAAGGSSLTERTWSSLAGEKERFIAFIAFPYRLHVAVLAVIAIGAGLVHKNRAVRLMAWSVIVHLVFFIFFVKYCKSPRYITVMMPFITILWAEWIVALWRQPCLVATMPPATSSGRGTKVLAAVVFCLVGVSQCVGNLLYLWQFRQADTAAVCREIDKMIPPKSTIYGGMTFAFPLHDHTYVPYMRMSWKRAIAEFRPNVAILDDRVMVNGSYPGEWDELRAELHAYMAEHGRLLGSINNAFYGDLKLYEVLYPGAADEK